MNTFFNRQVLTKLFATMGCGLAISCGSVGNDKADNFVANGTQKSPPFGCEEPVADQSYDKEVVVVGNKDGAAAARRLFLDANNQLVGVITDTAIQTVVSKIAYNENNQIKALIQRADGKAETGATGFTAYTYHEFSYPKSTEGSKLTQQVKLWRGACPQQGEVTPTEYAQLETITNVYDGNEPSYLKLVYRDTPKGVFTFGELEDITTKGGDTHYRRLIAKDGTKLYAEVLSANGTIVKIEGVEGTPFDTTTYGQLSDLGGTSAEGTVPQALLDVTNDGQLLPTLQYAWYTVDRVTSKNGSKLFYVGAKPGPNGINQSGSEGESTSGNVPVSEQALQAAIEASTTHCSLYPNFGCLEVTVPTYRMMSGNISIDSGDIENWATYLNVRF